MIYLMMNLDFWPTVSLLLNIRVRTLNLKGFAPRFHELTLINALLNTNKL